MKRALFSFLLTLLISLATKAQPKLVVGIVVDQMRYDYLTRYESRFCDSGFKRLMDEGFNYENGHYNYVPTYTGPGHASIYTGTTPSVHGIIGNDWYDRGRGDFMYCTEDSGGQSPRNLMSTTLTDQLALHTQFRSRIVGISVKDRGAILPAGHAATGAYWYDGKTGKLVSSSWYGKELPAWVNSFNKQGKALGFLDQVWNPLYPLNTYSASAPDNNPYENSLKKGGDPVFPYNLKELQSEWGYKLLSFTPFSNTYLVDAALAAIDGEKLGESGVSDFLCLSFSGPDYMGHFFGPQAVEIEDMYLRLDREIARLLYELDTKLGKGNYTVFLTADHGGNEVPALLKEHGMFAGLLNMDSMQKQVKKAVLEHFGDSLVLGIVNEQVYFDHVRIKAKGLDLTEVCWVASEALIGFPGVYRTYTVNDLLVAMDPAVEKFRNGYHPLRSGDLFIHSLPGWMDHDTKGTTHGSGYTYDTRVPMLFYGYGVKQGKSSRTVAITDIAPSISLILGIQFPNGSTGKPLSEMLGY
ncbi:MAG: alkaline phosphatase PafA [Bacteroidia bacterium]